MIPLSSDEAAAGSRLVRVISALLTLAEGGTFLPDGKSSPLPLPAAQSLISFGMPGEGQRFMLLIGDFIGFLPS